MTANWIKELEYIYADGGEWDDFVVTLERINKLLKLTGTYVEPAWLYDKVQEEIKEVE